MDMLVPLILAVSGIVIIFLCMILGYIGINIEIKGIKRSAKKITKEIIEIKNNMNNMEDKIRENKGE